MSYKFIYFDLDNTLLDHQAAENSALRDVHSNYTLFNEIKYQTLLDVYDEVNSRQWRQYSLGEISRSDLQKNRFKQTLQQLQLSADRFQEVGDYYLQCYRKYWQWVQGAEEVYNEVRKHFPVGLLTNGFSETQQLKFEKLGMYESATHVVISEDVGALKPDPIVFQHATELVGCEPADILYVGDSFPSDIEGGAGYGWNTAWYTNNGEKEKHEKADFVFSNFRELSDYLNI